MHSKIISISLMLTLLFILQNCDNQIADQTAKQQDINDITFKNGSTASVNGIDLKQIDEKLNQLAKLTAVALQDVEFRKILASEIEKQLTGDYEALYSNLRKYKIGNRSFTGYMAQLIKEYSNSDKLGTQKLYATLGLIPKLHFSMPVNFHKWNPQNYIPMVTYAPNNKRDNEIDYVAAYNKHGERLNISAKTPPVEPVIVLGVNERVGKKFISIDKKSNSNTEYRVQYIDPCDSCGGGGDGSGSGAREEGALDYIYKLKGSNLGDYEPWIRGKLEMWLQVAFEKGANNEDKRFGAKRGDLKDGYNPDLLIRNWYTDDYGDVSAYEFRERDYGGTYTHTWTYNEGGHEIVFTFKHEGGDEFIGKTVVHFNDPPRRYDLGDFDFWLNFIN